MGTPTGHNTIMAIAWCVGIARLPYLWAKTLFDRRPAR